MIKIKPICDEVSNSIYTAKGIRSIFSLAPSYDATSGGLQVYITPLSVESTREARDGVANTVTIQLLWCVRCDGHTSQTITDTLDAVQDVAEYLLAGELTVTDDGSIWYVSAVESSGTQFLSSSKMAGGLIDSVELEENYILQSPLILTLEN